MNRHSSRSHAVCTVKVERTVGPQETPQDDHSDIAVAAEGETRADGAAGADGEECDSADGAGSSGAAGMRAVEAEAEERAKASAALSHALSASAGEVAVSARLTLVDLAGSERVKRTAASGATFTEAKNINLSLLELGNVIHALSEASSTSHEPPSAAAAAEKARHVPFRNSSLTRLLQESLGGNCKTSLLLCVSPALADASETKGTLAFGSRAMRVRQEAIINARANYEVCTRRVALRTRVVVALSLAAGCRHASAWPPRCAHEIHACRHAARSLFSRSRCVV
jgi:hypothetical protein